MGSVKNNNMDDQVKAKFEDFAPPIPADLWNKIESELDTAEPTETMPIKRIRLSFSIYGGAVAATLLIAFAFWKFGDNETIDLRRRPEVYTSKTPFEGNESVQGSKKEERRAQQESLLKVDPVDVVERPIKITEKVPPRLQTLEVKLARETGLASSLNEVDYNAVDAKSAFSLSVSEAPLAMQEALPLESEVIALQKNRPFQKDDVQGSFVEEINTSKGKRIGVSTVLNFLAKGLSSENGKSIEFSESEEGILKLDLNFGLAKSRD